ncbi:multifunctional tryptophan biosynthesis protein [Skeletonema marinoi]|uniref:Multifunctional tryptophan biosynthesis protein n=1 Tax=Skeletonema marinoi TaxID=267567 RepID=A0AAD8YA47_9STRA|nr:multifunctional tryptophan biosynthesis protein [Skeletonema marinoi]
MAPQNTSSSGSSAPASRPSYTDEQLHNALLNFYGGSSATAETCGHIFGFGNPNHEMSMLQRITATTMLDYESKLNCGQDNTDDAVPSIATLLEQASSFHTAHGPILPLQSIIQSKSPCMTLAAEFKRASPSKGDIASHLHAGEQACVYFGAELINFARSIGIEPLVEVHALVELDVAISAGAKVIGVNNRNLHTFQMDLVQTEKVAEELTKRGLTFHHDDCLKEDGDKPQLSVCALSGMSSAHDVDRYRNVGVGMCLIGESLMRATDAGVAIKGLCLDPKDYAASQSVSGGAYTGGTKMIKICGLTNPQDALVACRAGANLLGVIFAEKSKRKVSVEQARDIVDAVRKFGERSDRMEVKINDSNKVTPLSALVAKSRALELAARRPLVVGVFQNQSFDFIQEMVDKCGLDLVQLSTDNLDNRTAELELQRVRNLWQLHGSEGMEAANSSNFGVPALRVVDIELGSDGTEEEKKDRSSMDTAAAILSTVTSDPIAILLDTSIKGDKHGGGGTGKTFDWTIAESIQNMGLPVIIAGGLTPDNIGEAVGNVRPFGIDVAGGVEAGPGVKDVDKLQKFIGGAKKAAVEASKGF